MARPVPLPRSCRGYVLVSRFADGAGVLLFLFGGWLGDGRGAIDGCSRRAAPLAGESCTLRYVPRYVYACTSTV